MKKLILLCGLLSLAACADPVPAPTNATNVTDQQPRRDIDECPRADGKQCL